MQIMLHNWRCFTQQSFELPKDSFCLVDKNGSGKSSLLYAIYSIYTGQSWPGTKLIQNITNDQLYFGILTNHIDWSLTGQVNKFNSLKTVFNNPYNSNKLPHIFTYSPDDNYWLKQPRHIKLQGLDQLLIAINPDYQLLVSSLDKYARAKQRMLKTESFKDIRLVIITTKKIIELTKRIWSIRAKFLNYLNNQLYQFEEWIQSPLHDWSISYTITNLNGEKKPYSGELVYTESTIIDLWKKEKIIKKVLFGAHRDDFDIKSNNTNARYTLSRGENRLLILYIKYLTQLKARKVNKQKPIWWLLDDFDSELDSIRQIILEKNILNNIDYYVSSGTKTPKKYAKKYSIDDLCIGIRKV